MSRPDEDSPVPDIICLVLQQSSAVWFELKAGEPTYHKLVRITGEAAEPGRYPVSRYGKGQGVDVHLVLNTSLDELDTVPMDSRNLLPLKRIEKRRQLYLHQRRRRESSFYPVPDDGGSVLAVELQHIIPEHWSRYLVQLQGQGVSFVSVATGTELLCDWIRRESDSVLLEYAIGDEYRHLVVAQGIPVMLRQLPAAIRGTGAGLHNHSGADQQLQWTLEQMRDSGLDVAIPAETWCIDRDVQGYPAELIHDARLMARLMVGSAPDVRKSKLNKPDMHGVKTEPFDASSGSFCKAPISFNSIKPSNPAKTWSPLRRPWKSYESLAVSVRQRVMLDRLRLINHLTVALAVCGLISLTVTAWTGVNDLMDRRELQQEQAGNQDRRAELSSQAKTIHPFADRLAETVMTIEQFDQIIKFEPGFILTQVASSVTAVNGVSLDELIWSALDESALELNVLNGIRHVPVRRRLWSSHRLQPAAVRVELAGSVSGIDLTVQKQRLDRFISQLQENSQVTAIKVMQSPVDAARSSERAALNTSAYRIVLDMEQG